MSRPLRSIANALAFAALSLGLALDASAAEVRAGVSTRETYVGLPVSLQIQVSNATQSDPPTIPEIDGLRIKSLGTPSRSTQTTIINGNVSSSSTVTYAYEVTPTRPGSFRIPPITVQVDGRAALTRAFDFVASKSKTGDLLFVEIAGKQKQIYVGQSLDLTLKIWLRPYHDRDRNITLSDGDMWQLLAQRTAFGPFEQQVRQLDENHQRPAGKEVLRKDSGGVEHSYYLYEVDATIYPKKPGPIDAGDVQVVVQYPTAIGQSRDPFASFFDDMSMPGGRGGMFDESMFAPFGSRLEVQSVRPIVAEATVEPIDVLPIPTARRPADYRGAVGSYQIVTEASPSNVKAGDPINLVIGVAGTGPMELVQAPPLAELPPLVADFKVPDEPLAGFVQGNRKIFSTTIRPRKEGVTEIPAISFSYFDPQTAKFVTVRSQPISIHVEPADTLALGDVVGRSKAAAGDHAVAQVADAAVASPQLAIFTGNGLLTNQLPPAMISPRLAVPLALAPLAVLGLLIYRSRGGVAALAGRFGSSHRKFQTRIREAEQPADVSAALRSLLARRFGLSGSQADATTLIGALRSIGYRNLAVRCERILNECDAHGQVGFNGLPLSELQHNALQLVDDLQSEAARPRPKARISRVAHRRAAVVGDARSLRATTLLTSIATSLVLITTNARAAVELATLVALTPAQQQSLLTEANERYQLALSSIANDSAEAKQAFADAAEKYQLLVDAGVRNSQLFFNTANAYLESGDTARAIANYLRSLRLDPTNRDARTNLAYAETLLPTSATDTSHATRSLADYATIANDWLNQAVSPRAVLTVGILAWFAFWAAIVARLLALRVAWKSLATAALAVTAVAATSYTLSCQSLNEPTAIIITPTATLRTGDGENFASVTGSEFHAGQSVEHLKHRGHWLQVRTPNGRTGWLPDATVEIL
jgi:tetratricopeptide (TPR) repeat protein